MSWDSIVAGNAAYQVQEKRAEEVNGVMTVAEQGYKNIRPAYVVWTSIDDITEDSKVVENFTDIELHEYELRGFIRITYQGYQSWARIKQRTGKEAYYLGSYNLITEGWSREAIINHGGKPLGSTDFSELDPDVQRKLIKNLEATQVKQLVAELNAYTGNNPWQDVILGSYEVTEESIDGDSTIVKLRGGSTIMWIEESKSWEIIC